MAITGVMRLGFVAIRVMDLDKAIEHYCGVLGLRESGRETGRVYLKGWDEHDHHSVVLIESDRAGMEYCGFKVRTEEDLVTFQNKLEALGVATEKVAATDLLGEALRFQVPTGHEIYLYASMKRVGNELNTRNPEFEPDGLVGLAAPMMEHCLLYGPNIAETEKIFCDGLGFSPSERLVAPDGVVKATFLASGTKMHEIAFIEHEESAKFHHVSFWLGSDDAIMRAANLFGKLGIRIDEGPTQHGIGRARTIYFFDPSGNRNEVFSGSYYYYPDKPTLTWDATEIGKAISYPQRRMNESFMTVLT